MIRISSRQTISKHDFVSLRVFLTISTSKYIRIVFSCYHISSYHALPLPSPLIVGLVALGGLDAVSIDLSPPLLQAEEVRLPYLLPAASEEDSEQEAEEEDLLLSSLGVCGVCSETCAPLCKARQEVEFLRCCQEVRERERNQRRGLPHCRKADTVITSNYEPFDISIVCVHRHSTKMFKLLHLRSYFLHQSSNPLVTLHWYFVGIFK